MAAVTQEKEEAARRKITIDLAVPWIRNLSVAELQQHWKKCGSTNRDARLRKGKGDRLKEYNGVKFAGR
jgi:hypothetical protein